MAETIFSLAVVAGLLVTAGFLFFLFHKNKDLEEKRTEAQKQIEELLYSINERDVLMERGSQSLIEANSKLIEQNDLIKALAEKLEFSEKQYDALLGQKKSSEVRTGKITEQISPFLNDYPLNPKTARFLGDPIDFVHFDEDKITFVEVKSGKSQLSKKQRRIRDLIAARKVDFQIYRVSGDGDGPNKS